jgi:anti-sigma regulatory factor (Ser/Thr protein kinase)
MHVRASALCLFSQALAYVRAGDLAASYSLGSAVQQSGCRGVFVASASNDASLLTDPVAGSNGAVVGGAVRSRGLMIVLEAVPAALSVVRAQARAWLEEWGWPLADAEDIELAVNEAVANVIDHAYPPEKTGSVSVRAWVSVHPGAGERRVVVAVTDRGRWGTHQPDAPPVSARGHGLVVMNGCMAELRIQRGAAGTTILMVSYPVPSIPHP